MTDLEALLLGVLRDEGRCHGLDVGKIAADRADRVLGAGSLYRTLHRLEQQGLVTAEWEDPDVDPPHQGPPRRYYRLAAMGARALNEYKTEIPIDDFTSDRLLIAYRVDGATVPVREKGPLWIVYDYDSDEALKTEVYFGRSIWQLKSLEFR